MQTEKRHIGLAVILAMTMALGPFALDTYIPAFPEIASSLKVTVHQVSLTISIYIFFLAFGQLCGGPLSDRFGRSKIMTFGISLFALSSLALVYAQSLPEFLTLRILQAFGGGFATVTVPALIRDHLSGKEAAKFFSFLGLLMVLAPSLAPNIGALILHFASWPAIFAFLAIYAVIVIFSLRVKVFKGIPKPPSFDKMSAWKRYQNVIRKRDGMLFVLLGSLTFSILLLFITHSSFIYQQHFNLSPHHFSLLFSANLVFMLLMNLINRKLLNHFESVRILKWSITLQLSALLVLLIFSVLHAELAFIAPALIVAIGCMGAINPNIQACYMEYFPKNGGTAAALMGATKFSIAGLISAVSTLLPEKISYIVIAQVFLSFVCAILIWVNQKTKSVK